VRSSTGVPGGAPASDSPPGPSLALLGGSVSSARALEPPAPSSSERAHGSLLGVSDAGEKAAAFACAHERASRA
jgi:hypothetical protein